MTRNFSNSLSGIPESINTDLNENSNIVDIQSRDFDTLELGVGTHENLN